MPQKKIIPHHLAGDLPGQTPTEAFSYIEGRAKHDERTGELIFPEPGEDDWLDHVAETADDSREQYRARRRAMTAERKRIETGQDKKDKDGLKWLDDNRWHVVQNFRHLAKEVLALQKTVRLADEPGEKALALRLFGEKNAELQNMLENGEGTQDTLIFEEIYREYIREELRYFEFDQALTEYYRISTYLEEGGFPKLSESKRTFDSDEERVEWFAMLSRVEHAMSTVTLTGEESAQDLEKKLLGELAFVYAPESTEFKEQAKIIREGIRTTLHGRGMQSKQDLERRRDELKEKVEELWRQPGIRRFEKMRAIDRIVKAAAADKDVLEMPSVIEHLNQLHDLEMAHPDTTVGAVIVGPPGVGKTTEIRYYLELKNRKYSYVDLSKDATRYLLLGSKSLEFQSPTEYIDNLRKNIQGLDTAGLTDFVREHAQTISNIFNIHPDNAVAPLIGMLREAMSEPSKAFDSDQIATLKEKLDGVINKVYRNQLATDLGHLVTKNGWRDGVIVAALREGRSVIADEFNMMKDWSALRSLLTAKPGESWYFADNNETLPIPRNFRIYFTGNIGKKHGTMEVPEAEASRYTGKVVERVYPPQEEAMLVAMALMSNPDGKFLGTHEDMVSLYYLVDQAIPLIRKFSEERQNVPTIPISYRTLRALAEKLVIRKDPRTGQPIFRRRKDVTFDQALYEVLVGTHSVYENNEYKKGVVDACTTVGLMLDESVRKVIVEEKQWLKEEEFNEKQKKYQEQYKEDYEAPIKKMKGLIQNLNFTSTPIRFKDSK